MNKSLLWVVVGGVVIYYILKSAFKPKSQIQTHFEEEVTKQKLAANANTQQSNAQPVNSIFGALPLVGVVYDWFAMANGEDPVKGNDLMLNFKAGQNFGNVPAATQAEYEASVMSAYSGLITKIQ